MDLFILLLKTEIVSTDALTLKKKTSERKPVMNTRTIII
jgi:hypothetical protein